MSVSLVSELWTATCVASGLSAVLTQDWWNVVLNRYTEPQRHYHTMEHLSELTTLYRELESRSLLREPKAVAWTIFFHDIIYDPKRNDNEEESARVWFEFCDAMAKEPNATKDAQLNTTVRQYILQTKNHMAAPLDSPNDLLLFLDMDIAILGAHRDRYAEYATQIRREYAHYPQAAYCKGRAAVLKNFAAHQPLFKTQLFRDRLGAQAEQNLNWELIQLECPAMRDVRLYFADKDAVVHFEADHGRRDLLRLDEEAFTHILSLNAGAFAHGAELRDGSGYAAALIASASYTKPEADKLFCAVASGAKTFEDIASAVAAADPYTQQSAVDAEIGGDHIFIHTITVARQLRRRGIATKLLSDYLELIAKEFGHVRWISALVPDTLVPLFTRFGFIVVRSGDVETFASASLRSQVPSPGPRSTGDESSVPPTPSPHAGQRRGIAGPVITPSTIFSEMILRVQAHAT